MAAASNAIEIELDGRDVRITNPDKVFFPESPAGPLTKLDLVQYYLAVAPGALVGCRDRPNMLHRYPDGVDGEEIYQKRVPPHRPPWIQTATVRFPSGRSAEFLAIQDAAHLAWAINLGCLDLNPWPVRCGDVDTPTSCGSTSTPRPRLPSTMPGRWPSSSRRCWRSMASPGTPRPRASAAST
jgi:DNA primase